MSPYETSGASHETITKQVFQGIGKPHEGPWFRTEDGCSVDDLSADRHPAQYEADEGLISAVNVAMLLNKPLLLTGSPGCGKSDLAERVAWELQCGPVLRFEAQSLSEANDLFYRFDLVGRMAESRIRSDAGIFQHKGYSAGHLSDPTHPAHFVEFGPLGKAIFRAGAKPNGRDEAKQELFEYLRRKIVGNDNEFKQQRSVVLIDEIDKASRDFPNDLLNGIDRMEFKIRELDNLLVRTPEKSTCLHPIVVITSNLERDLPAPFLRRCAFYHIPDPTRERMARIVRLRIFPDREDLRDGEIPGFYRQLLECFFDYREQHGRGQAYEAGTTELLDVAQVLLRQGVADEATVASERVLVKQAIALMAKHPEDAQRLSRFLDTWQPTRL
ncbi:AAA family ATPase [Azotobacter beijerinckii]|uniref:ATPase family associated with various cellular activities (AAA) n=1 Tax=Azotobacter beijerinckii TaxID=170623 RepID=A0A1I1CUT6_9GAMM|nr:MoxR family ATPase [Azotobacter beijerinckii]SFB64668.1 ATPase family associated with various cellular activities (AAA) [Azotobacter beijerinckii]